ncbi:MAG: hypothetical protein EU548_03090 [Promethearchaeota archaeon]|nr:MAG: hypothetical protein EU548_03090 [Candidatus Lokiarchaeota archaeon]
MNSKVKKVVAEVPHRISGFFEIVDEINGKKIENPENIGSSGAGFNLSALGRTEIVVYDNSELKKDHIEIHINDEKLNEEAETTDYILHYMKKYIPDPVNLKVFHEFELPVGCGYGTSGSGALGVVFGLNEIFNLKLSYQELGRIAHIAEVVNRTGLGTVCGQLAGGLCILKKAGYPCSYDLIEYPEGINVICGTFGILPTKSILNDPVLSLKIKRAGQKALQRLINQPSLKEFVSASIDFVRETEILDILDLEIIKDIINDLNKLDILGASMNQLGRSFYAICKQKSLKNVMGIINSYKPEIKIYNLAISKKTPKVIGKK